MKSKKICVWSGKRGGFGALTPTMRAIQAHEALELALVVTDQHLYDQFGRTVREACVCNDRSMCWPIWRPMSCW